MNCQGYTKYRFAYKAKIPGHIMWKLSVQQPHNALEDLTWEKHHNAIIARAYKKLVLIQRI